MNDITELCDILLTLGGKASLSNICKEYGIRYKMFIAPQHETIIESTLKNSSHIVYYDTDLCVWSLIAKTPKPNAFPRGNTETNKSGDVNFLRDTVYEWATKKMKDGAILEIFGNRGQRQTLVTPFIAKLVPQVPSLINEKQAGYFCLYEIEIRPQEAVVRLMATVTKKTPDSIIDIYKKTILPSISKVYREDGKFYNKTFSSMKICTETTNTEIVAFMEKALMLIQAYEKNIERSQLKS